MAPAEVCRASFRGGTTNRVKFSPAVDLDMLSYVRNVNPFRDQREWTHIAAKMQDLTNQPFTSWTVREHTYLLLGRFVAKDRVAPRRSGTEEDYGQREALLQEILDLARERGVKIRAPRRADAASGRRAARAHLRNGATTAAARNSAALARDAAAELHVARNTVDGACECIRQCSCRQPA
ncbi:hypothetical protein HPB49_008701 [Dermacentor silvarum]|uniref:Uncharacterized protein n=1 Tax=Dermacentor silvarum TaxID=543639 RepID=A0ACB8DBB8_DERSI|nr:hypothetical protein HPB49_008701 [Dermacentor silvarum]